MCQKKDMVKHGYQPSKPKTVSIPTKTLNEAYQPTTATITPPPYKGTSISKPKKKKD